MPFEIHKNPDPPREIVMGGPKAQPPPVENKQGRKKMVDKLKDETGVKKISEEPADKPGPVGTSTPPPAQDVDAEVKIGGDKEGDNA